MVMVFIGPMPGIWRSSWSSALAVSGVASGISGVTGRPVQFP